MRTQRYIFALPLCLAMLLCCALPGLAQDDEASESRNIFTIFTDTFDGYLEHATSTRIHKFDYLTQMKNSLRLKYETDFAEHFTLKLDGLAVYDAAYDINDDLGFPEDDDYRAYVDLREGTLLAAFEKFDLRLGRQQVIWEVTDGLRVLDIVNPMNLRTFILDDLENLRIPLWMAKCDYYFTFDYSLQALIIPDMTFNDMADAGSEFAFSFPPPPTGVQQVIVNDTEEPDMNIENTRYGLRFKGLAKGWDFTLNYLYTWDHVPTQKKQIDPETGTLTISPEYERMHLLGASAVNVFWDAVFRVEIAAKFDQFFSVSDPTIPDMVLSKDTFEYALAFERDILSITWLAQAMQRYILNYDDAITDERVNTALTLRGSKTLNDEETFELTVVGMYRVQDHDYLIRPYFEYDITDAWRLTAGVDIFGGGDEYSFLGQFEEKDRVYAEVRYSF